VRRGAALALVILLAACSGGRVADAPAPSGPQARHARLAPGTAAVVGDAPIAASLVADVARAESVTPAEALDRLVADALIAQGARAAGEDTAEPAAWTLETVLALATADRARAAALAAGPPTDDEVARLSDVHWREVNLPEQVKAVQAAVVMPKDPSRRDAAKALAAKLAPVLAAATSEDDFDARAKAFPSEGFEIHVDHLPFFVDDGRTSEGALSLMHPTFAHAVFVLKEPGDTTGVIETSLGWHVARLLARRPANILPFAERRVRFAGEVYASRGRATVQSILAAQSARMRPEIAPDAVQLMALVAAPSVSP
jgi:peptidyl-prolyl cis-trans isomerase C